MRSNDLKKQKQELEETRNKKVQRDWEAVLDTPAGRRVIYQILLLCGEEFVSAYDKNNSHNTAYLNGKRDVGTSIRLLLKKYKRESIFRMEDEYKSNIGEEQKALNKINKEIEESED